MIDKGVPYASDVWDRNMSTYMIKMANRHQKKIDKYCLELQTKVDRLFEKLRTTGVEVGESDGDSSRVLRIDPLMRWMPSCAEMDTPGRPEGRGRREGGTAPWVFQGDSQSAPVTGRIRGLKWV
jgi:hypothetical protein